MHAAGRASSYRSTGCMCICVVCVHAWHVCPYLLCGVMSGGDRKLGPFEFSACIEWNGTVEWFLPNKRHV